MYNMINFENYSSNTRKTEYLPKWAQEEQIYNCENSWKGFFVKYISKLFS